ncbi:MAG TPA: ATP-binding protein, partial [Magnetospirillaceae bacterium]|nr:ATP-binding protein [Magnetospirillaceae bacterium]
MRPERYLGSMAGRLFVFLLIGVMGSAILALGLADARRRSDLQQIQLERVVDRVQDLRLLANRASPSVRAELIVNGVPGLRPLSANEKVEGVDVELTQRLAARMGPGVKAETVTPSTCFPRSSAASFDVICWVVSVDLADHTPMRLIAMSPRTDSFNLPSFDPLFLSVLALGMSVLTFLAARMAAAPLGHLSRAARALGGNLDSSPLPERGPYEVREAARAFNAMQATLRTHIVERTRILASIAHDLQTPLTRLRLRCEKVDDAALRSRLIDDMNGMQVLIRQGIDFYRSNQTEEPFTRLALDSLLESVVEDAAEGGHIVTLRSRSHYDVEARPHALQRCLANLVDNALNYGGATEVSAEFENGEIHIRIRDHGPGIPAEKLESVFQPFVRLEALPTHSGGGVGLGLSIARALAQKNDADLTLTNHPDGGLEACLTLRRGLVPSDRAFQNSTVAVSRAEIGSNG